MPLFAVQVLARVVEGALARPVLFVSAEEADTASWQLMGVVP
jgi:hypothetical protein